VTVWHDGPVGQRLAAVARGAALRRGVAAAIVAAGIVLALVRLPAAHNDLSRAAAAEIGRTDVNGALAVADPLAIDNEFVRAAVATVQRGDEFAVVLPPQPNASVAPLTAEALPDFMQNVLLPAREVATPAAGDYVLCYVCDMSRWNGRTQWLWSDSNGVAIGKVER
jgi:hypothetical protein